MSAFSFLTAFFKSRRYASSIGLKVLAFEPQFKVFQAFERNLSLNLEAKKNIRAEFALVVGAKDAESLNHSFTPGASGPLSQDGLSSRAFTIQDILEWQPIDSRTAIKIDIEGAEFPLFGNPETVHLLQIKHPRIYLALHPGFKNPLPSNAGALRKIFWRFGAVVDILSLYRSVRNKATIQNAIRKNKVGIFGLLKGLLRDEKDYILIF
jgi:FkbM family methyltransferase